MSVLESSNLRDLLRVRDNEDDGRDALAGLTLAAVLGCERNLTRRPSRTLLDIIKDEESGAAYRGLLIPSNDNNPNNKNSWKSFKNRLRIRRAGTAFSSSTTSHPVNACDFAIEECNIRISQPILVEHRGVSRSPSLIGARNSNSSSNGVEIMREEEERPEREIGSSSTAEQRVTIETIENPAQQRLARAISMNSTENVAVAGVEAEAAPPAPVPATPRVSLMALLEETEWNSAGHVGPLETMTDEAEEELDDEKKDKGERGGGEYVCCVCMVRHKGAAFIPCGHTFCRLCSRELWVNRGNCPLCNGYILEILDIF